MDGLSRPGTLRAGKRTQDGCTAGTTRGSGRRALARRWKGPWNEDDLARRSWSCLASAALRRRHKIAGIALTGGFLVDDERSIAAGRRLELVVLIVVNVHAAAPASG